jgi:hypothetical protein
MDLWLFSRHRRGRRHLRHALLLRNSSTAGSMAALSSPLITEVATMTSQRSLNAIVRTAAVEPRHVLTS